jgi:LysM repeat protein
MVEERTREAIRQYDLFKFMVTIILVIIIGILLVRWNASRPVLEPTRPAPVVGAATATPSPTLEPTRPASPTTMPSPTPKIEPPVLVLPQGDIEPGDVVLTGTGTPGSKARLIVGGEIAVTTAIGQDGKWTLTTTIDQPGRYEMSVQTVGENGDILAESTPATLKVGSLFAPLTTKTPELGEFVTDADGRAAGQLALSGTGEPGAIVQLWAGAQLIGSTTVNDDGNWRFAQQVALSSGAHDLFAQMIDAQGNELATSEPVTIEIEAKPAIATPTLGLRSTEGEMTLSGTGTPGSRIDLVANGQLLETVNVGQDGQWSVTVQLDPGEYALVARALDAQGRIVAESDVLEAVQPEPEIAAPALTAPQEGVELEAGTIALSGTGEPGANLEILDNGDLIGTVVVQADGTWTFEYEFEAGTHALAVQNAQDSTSLSPGVRVQVTPVAAEDGVEPGETASATCPADPPRGIDRGDTYVVARCEYMALIAQRAGVGLADLISINPQIEEPAVIYPEQVLNLPPRGD